MSVRVRETIAAHAIKNSSVSTGVSVLGLRNSDFGVFLGLRISDSEFFQLSAVCSSFCCRKP